MDFLKNQAVKIQQQLAGLSPSQRMLAASLVAIMVMTLLLWNKYASNSEMENLLPQAVTPEALTQITAALGSSGIKYQVTGSGVMVPSEQKYQALAVLGSSNALPDSTYQAFDKMVQQISPFSSSWQGQAMLTQAKARMLSQVLSKYKGVESATVMLDTSSRRSIGSPEAPASAAITIMTKGRVPMNAAEIQAAANFVRGANVGLTNKNITVSVNGQPFDLEDPEAGGLGSGLRQLEAQKAWAADFKDQVEGLLRIPGARAVVAVSVNDAETHVETLDPSKEKSFVLTKMKSADSVETSQSSPTNAEPGAGTNLGVNVAGGGGGEVSTSGESRDKTENAVVVAQTNTTTRRLPGKGTATGASVWVPRSYLLREAKGGRADAKEPDAATVLQMEKQQSISLQESVMQILNIADARKVSIKFYVDDPLPAAPADPQTAGITLPLGIGGYAKEIAMGLLALVSLFMVSMMVRKNAPPPIITIPEVVSTGPVMIESGEAVAGEVGAGDLTLDGMELDEDAVKTQQMQEQVATMVKENPDAAAVLVKRWLNR